MTSLTAAIPTVILFPLLMLAAFMIVYLIETVAYYSRAGWYYRTGPAILRERWQSAANAEQVREIIRPLLRADQLVGRESADGFQFRQRAASVNAWTRIHLWFENTERGVALHYEVRPFYSMGLLLFPIVWLSSGAFGMRGLTLVWSAGLTAFVFAGYKWIMPWDVARMNRLPTVRRALAPFGLSVCERCGYDLFGHSTASRCPECGSDSPPP